MNRYSFAFVFSFVFLILLPLYAFAGEFNQIQKILASDGGSGGFFGQSVSLSNDGSVAILGDPMDKAKGTSSGAAYVFVKNSDDEWEQQDKLIASDSAARAFFGNSVSVSGDGSLVLVGAYRGDVEGSETGAAYVFVKNSDEEWKQQDKLTAQDGATSDLFGYSVSLSNDGSMALVGAYGDGDKGISSGSAYVFVKNSDDEWEQQGKLIASDGAEYDFFGWSVSLSGDGSRALVGAPMDDDKGISSGSAYVFVKNSDDEWEQQDKLIAPDSAALDQFGWSVSLSSDGSLALVGAIGDGDKGISSGSAYVFVKNSAGDWEQQDKITAPDGERNDSFGKSVSLSSDGSKALVGAYRDADNGLSSGSAYVFVKNSDDEWEHQDKLVASDGEANDEFGYSVSLSGDGFVTLVGAFLDDPIGSAFVHNWQDKPDIREDGASISDSDGTATTVTINATVNTNGLTTTVTLSYTGEDGSTGSKSITLSALSYTTDVAIVLSGLTAGTKYSYTVSATNTEGAVSSFAYYFITSDNTNSDSDGDNTNSDSNGGTPQTLAVPAATPAQYALLAMLLLAPGCGMLRRMRR